MAFVDDVTEFLKENPADATEAPRALGCAVVEIEHHDSRRWAEIYHMVLQLKTKVSENPVEFKDEYVLVEYAEGSTELQEDIHENYPPEAFAVEPYEVVVTKFRPV